MISLLIDSTADIIYRVFMSHNGPYKSYTRERHSRNHSPVQRPRHSEQDSQEHHYHRSERRSRRRSPERYQDDTEQASREYSSHQRKRYSEDCSRMDNQGRPRYSSREYDYYNTQSQHPTHRHKRSEEYLQSGQEQRYHRTEPYTQHDTRQHFREHPGGPNPEQYYRERKRHNRDYNDWYFEEPMKEARRERHTYATERGIPRSSGEYSVHRHRYAKSHRGCETKLPNKVRVDIPDSHGRPTETRSRTHGRDRAEQVRISDERWPRSARFRHRTSKADAEEQARQRAETLATEVRADNEDLEWCRSKSKGKEREDVRARAE